MTLYQYNFSCPGLDDYLASKGSRIDIKEAFAFFENVHQESFSYVILKNENIYFILSRYSILYTSSLKLDQRLMRLFGKEQDGDYAKVAFYDGRALGQNDF